MLGETERMSGCHCQDVEEMEEVREVEGELYSKVSVVQHITAKHVKDPNSGASG